MTVAPALSCAGAASSGLSISGDCAKAPAETASMLSAIVLCVSFFDLQILPPELPSRRSNQYIAE